MAGGAQAQSPDILRGTDPYRLVDRNSDGRYDGAGEAYDYKSLNSSANNLVFGGTRIYESEARRPHRIRSYWDANGDGLIDVATEAEPARGNGRVLCEEEDSNQILAFEDLNGDGDVNDAGECTVYFDGSLDSTGAVSDIRSLSGMTMDNGSLMVLGDRAGTSGTNEVLLCLFDINGDDDANDPMEAFEAWDLGCDRQLGELLVVPIASLAFTTDGVGLSRSALTLPTDPLFEGTTFYFQNVVIDPSIAPFSVATSGGIGLTFGRLRDARCSP